MKHLDGEEQHCPRNGHCSCGESNDCYKMEGTLGGTALVQIYGGFSLKDLDMSSGVSFRKTSSYLARKRLRLSQFALMFEKADTLA